MAKRALSYPEAGMHRAGRSRVLCVPGNFNGMRKLIYLAALAIAWGCSTSPITAPATAATLSWRFAGLNAVRENKDMVTWREVTGLPEFAGFNSNLVQRVSLSLAKGLAHGGR